MENTEQNQPTQPAAEAAAPQQVSQSLTPEPKPKNRFLLPIFLSLFTLILGGGLVFVYFRFLRQEKVVPQPIVAPSVAPAPLPSPSPSPEVTAGWKIYRNEEYGLEIKYPQHLTVREGRGSRSSFSVGFVRKDNADLYEFTIDKNFGGGWMGKKYKEEKIIIDGMQGTISLWLLCNSDLPTTKEWEKCMQQLDITNYYTATLHALFEKGNDQWHVLYKSWKRDEEDNDREMQNLKQILSTFRFLD